MSFRRVTVIGLFLSIFVATLSVVTAQEAFDPVAGPYEWEQPDAAGDVTPSGADWADITALSATTLEDGTLVFRMKFVDLSEATGSMRYCLNFDIDDTGYQTGSKNVMAAGVAVTNEGACTWNNGRTSVGSPELDAGNDQIVITIAPDDIGSPAAGTPVKSIQAVIGFAAGAGDNDIHDVLTPSEEPTDYVYGGGIGVSTEEVFGLRTAEPHASGQPGETVAYALNVTNDGDAVAEFSLTVEGLQDVFSGQFSQAEGELGPGNSSAAELTITVPLDAEPAMHEFAVFAAGPNGGNASLNLTLEVLAPPEPTPIGSSPDDGNATALDNDTTPQNATEDGGSLPGPGAFAVLTVIVSVLGAAARARRTEGRR